MLGSEAVRMQGASCGWAVSSPRSVHGWLSASGEILTRTSCCNGDTDTELNFEMGCQGSVLAVVGTTRWSARNVFSPSACLMVATAPGVPMNPGNVTSFSATAGCETSIVVRAANIVFTDGSRLIIERWLVALSILSALLEAADEARGGDGGSEGGNASLACSRCGSFVTTVTATSDSSSRVVARSPLLLRDDMRRFLNLMTFAVTPTCVRLSGFSDSPMRVITRMYRSSLVSSSRGSSCAPAW
mmetsp:Transcript_4100/g.9179  ORF Transcript_4100/g.9179 Transcript_4100/m.9179 type:complete len:244 (+) Transcript_4100:3630-4361(+)